MLETIVGYFIGICDEIACLLSPKHRAAREEEARRDPFNRMFSLLARDMEIMNLYMELWQLKRIENLKKEIEEFERKHQYEKEREHERDQKWERALQIIKEMDDEEVIKIKEIIIREIEQKKKRDFPKNKRFS